MFMNKRRKLLLALTGASAATVWTKPVVDAVVLPAHAEMTTEETPVECGDLNFGPYTLSCGDAPSSYPAFDITIDESGPCPPFVVLTPNDNIYDPLTPLSLYSRQDSEFGLLRAQFGEFNNSAGQVRTTCPTGPLNIDESPFDIEVLGSGGINLYRATITSVVDVSGGSITFPLTTFAVV